VLIGSADERRLLFGGYADSAMIVELVRQVLDAQEAQPR